MASTCHALSLVVGSGKTKVSGENKGGKQTCQERMALPVAPTGFTTTGADRPESAMVAESSKGIGDWQRRKLWLSSARGRDATARCHQTRLVSHRQLELGTRSPPKKGWPAGRRRGRPAAECKQSGRESF